MRFYFILLLLSTFKLYGQAPLDAKSYLDNKQVSPFAKNFYNGKLKSSDGTKTLSIIDSLNTKNDSTRPFYIYLVSKMLDKADGALSEELGNACKEFVEQHPDYFFDFLFSGLKLSEKRFIVDWANAMASEIMIAHEGQEKQYLKKSMQVALTKTKPTNKSRLT